MASSSRRATWSLVFLVMLLASSEANPRTPNKNLLKRKLSEFKVAPVDSRIGERAIEDYRLPTALIPITQFNSLQPLLNGNLSIMGYTEITFDVSEATANITLHQLDITTNEASVTVYEEATPSNTFVISSFDYQADKHFWTASLAQNLVVGTRYVITMEFEGDLQSAYSGFFIASYIQAGSDVFYAATQFEPNGARQAFPCFDEPGFKYTFTTQLIREDHLMSASNMPLSTSGQAIGQPGWTADTYAISEIMPVYLNSFLVSDFGFSTYNDGTIPYKIYARTELVYSADYGLSVTSGSLNFYEGYFAVPYPLPKLDSSALPEFFSGAMENWGLMNYIDWTLLYDPDITTASTKQIICEIIGHEVAHDWFGNLVTVEWWDHIWIGEGSTEFYAYKGCNSVAPDMMVEDQFVAGVLQSALETDDSQNSHAILLSIEHPSEANNVFDSITYNKGSSLARMMEYIVTENTYKNAMTNYLTNYAFGNTVQDQLFGEVTTQAYADGTLDRSLTMKVIMDTWTLKMGYPVLTVERNTDGTALLTQERFLMNPDPNITDPTVYTWYIPVTYTTELAPDFDNFVVDWMLPSETQKTISGMPGPGQWVIFNVQNGGFFRVNYDIDSWDDIVDQLNADYTLIHEMNRVQLIADAFNFARSGLQDYTLALRMSEFLKSETEYSVIDIGTENMYYLDAMFRTATDYNTLKEYLLSIILPTYLDVGFADSTSDPHTEQRKRELSVSMSCYLDYPDCLTEASDLFAIWMLDQDDYTIISPNLKDPVYCHGVGEGGVTEFNALYNRYLATIYSTEKNNLLYGMACSQDVNIINSYLDLAFNETSGIPQSDVVYIISSIATTTLGESTAWDYIRNNDDAIASYTGSYNDVELYVLIVSDSFNTQARLQELEDFRTANAGDIGISGMVDGAIANCENNIQWMTDNYDEILTWLVSAGYGP